MGKVDPVQRPWLLFPTWCGDRERVGWQGLLGRWKEIGERWTTRQTNTIDSRGSPSPRDQKLSGVGEREKDLEPTNEKTPSDRYLPILQP